MQIRSGAIHLIKLEVEVVTFTPYSDSNNYNNDSVKSKIEKLNLKSL